MADLYGELPLAARRARSAASLFGCTMNCSQSPKIRSSPTELSTRPRYFDRQVTVPQLALSALCLPGRHYVLALRHTHPIQLAGRVDPVQAPEIVGIVGSCHFHPQVSFHGFAAVWVGVAELVDVHWPLLQSESFRLNHRHVAGAERQPCASRPAYAEGSAGATPGPAPAPLRHGVDTRRWALTPNRSSPACTAVR
jgi:hypothetical protein